MQPHKGSARSWVRIRSRMRAAQVHRALSTIAQDVVDLVRETMCDTVLSELSAAPTDARSRSRGGRQVCPICRTPNHGPSFKRMLSPPASGSGQHWRRNGCRAAEDCQCFALSCIYGHNTQPCLVLGSPENVYVNDCTCTHAGSAVQPAG